jgi:flagellar hook protein FlgE
MTIYVRKERHVMSAMFSSISGIQSNFKLMDIAAHNIANINTDGYQAKQAGLIAGDRVNISEMGSTLSNNYTLSGNITNDGTGINETGTVPSNVDLSTEMINLLSAKFGIEANLKAFKIASEMTRSSINLLA